MPDTEQTAPCPNHYEDGSKIFPEREYCTPPPNPATETPKARAQRQLCVVCWTNSYEPCEENDPGAEAYKDGTGFVHCVHCLLVEAHTKALAALTASRAEMEEWKKRSAQLCAIADETATKQAEIISGLRAETETLRKERDAERAKDAEAEEFTVVRGEIVRLGKELETTRADRDRLAGDIEAWKKKYYDVADAVCRESTGPEDLCRQARALRAERDTLLARIAEIEGRPGK